MKPLKRSRITDAGIEASSRLNSARSILIASHVKPDGDALGASAAISGAASSRGKKATMLLHEPLSERLEKLVPPVDSRISPGDFVEEAGKVDLLMIVDTCNLSQLGAIAEDLPRFREKTVVIDHHQTVEEIGSVRWIDTTAAAVGVMMLELFEYLNWNLDDHVAESLATAILTDTGWLRFSNTDTRCLEAVSRLVDSGVKMDDLFKRIYQTDRIEKLRLLAGALGGMQLHCNGRLAVMTITREDFKRTGAGADETENIVNEAMRIGEVEVAVIFMETGETIRVSLRSRKDIDVAEIAASLGGGGHTRAAGFQHAGSLPEARDVTIEAISGKLG